MELVLCMGNFLFNIYKTRNKSSQLSKGFSWKLWKINISLVSHLVFILQLTAFFIQIREFIGTRQFFLSSSFRDWNLIFYLSYRIEHETLRTKNSLVNINHMCHSCDSKLKFSSGTSNTHSVDRLFDFDLTISVVNSVILIWCDYVRSSMVPEQQLGNLRVS